jgi:succinate dehydrogenase/fumarate reductase cytochrome b subunit
MAKSINYYLIKAARISGWLLFGLVILFILTGFALRGGYGIEKWIDVKTAWLVHELFIWPFVAVFTVHSLVTIYFAMRRWGWIKKGSKARRPARRAPVSTSREGQQPHVAGS